MPRLCHAEACALLPYTGVPEKKGRKKLSKSECLLCSDHKLRRRSEIRLSDLMLFHPGPERLSKRIICETLRNIFD